MAEQQSILLTGATGNVGGVILEHLLSLPIPPKIMLALRNAPKQIPLFQQRYRTATSTGQLSFASIPDMTVPGAFDEAATSATAIIHAATPLGGEDDFVKSMIEPTWTIDRNVLEGAKKSRTVERVIICGTLLQALNASELFNPSITINESTFNPVTFEEASEGPWRNAYMFSKTNAERKTWEWVEQNKGAIGFDVVMMLPPMICGRSPQVGFKPTAEGPGGIPRIYNALFVSRKVEDVDFTFPFFLDTDDVARAHVLSLDRTKVMGNKRYLLASSEIMELRAIAARLRREEPVLRDRLPDVPEDPSRRSKEKLMKVDTGKSDAVFGTEWKSGYESVREIAMDVLKWEEKNGRIDGV